MSQTTNPARVRALDDAGHLRHCPDCGCRDLYLRRRGRTAVAGVATAGLLLAAAAGGVIGWPLALGGVAVAAVTAVACRLIRGPLPGDGGPVLVCYGCDARHGGVEPRAGQRRWDADLAARHHAADRTPGGAKPDPVRVVIAGDLAVPPPAADRRAKSAEAATVRGWASAGDRG